MGKKIKTGIHESKTDYRRTRDARRAAYWQVFKRNAFRNRYIAANVICLLMKGKPASISELTMRREPTYGQVRALKNLFFGSWTTDENFKLAMDKCRELDEAYAEEQKAKADEVNSRWAEARKDEQGDVPQVQLDPDHEPEIVFSEEV